MARIALPSTVLQAAAYLDRLALLELDFTSGAAYVYVCVPAQTYQELLQAESKGAYFNHRIRDHFACVKIRSGGLPPVRNSDPVD